LLKTFRWLKYIEAERLVEHKYPPQAHPASRSHGISLNPPRNMADNCFQKSRRFLAGNWRTYSQSQLLNAVRTYFENLASEI
jgi:hypothetical protein